MQFQMIGIEHIVPNKLNTRKNKEVGELADSIKTIGLINPIAVTTNKTNDGKYKIISGERRYWALKELDWKQAPCCVFDGKHEHSQLLAENIVRKNLTLIEEAEAVDSFLSKKYGEDYLALLYSPEKSNEKNRILYDLKALDLTSVKVNNLAKIVFMDKDTKEKIASKEISLEDAIKLSNIEDVTRQKEIAIKLSSKNTVKKNQARIEMESNSKNDFSVGDYLNKVKRNVELANDYLGFAFKGVESIDTKNILNIHKNFINDIKSEIALLKENALKIEKDFKEATKNG